MDADAETIAMDEATKAAESAKALENKEKEKKPKAIVRSTPKLATAAKSAAKPRHPLGKSAKCAAKPTGNS